MYGISTVMRGLDPRIHLLATKMDCRVSPLRGGPAMTNDCSYTDFSAQQQRTP